MKILTLNRLHHLHVNEHWRLCVLSTVSFWKASMFCHSILKCFLVLLKAHFVKDARFHYLHSGGKLVL